MIGVKVLVRPRLDLVMQESPKPEVNLHYRLNETYPTYLPIHSRHHAESLLGSTTFDSPWVTLIQGAPAGDHVYFQILGSPDRLIAEGGGTKGGSFWNWRATALPGDFRETTVGPHWYEVDVYESDLLTVDDSRRMIWPALANDLDLMCRQAGVRALFFE